MSVFSLICALLLEQFRPISNHNRFYALLIRFADYIRQTFDDGQARQGIIGWIVVVPLCVIVSSAIYGLLSYAHPLLGWMWCVLSVYLTIGFRKFSHTFTIITEGLQNKDFHTAQIALHQWIGANTHTPMMSIDSISKSAIENGVIACLHHVFAPIFWFFLLGLWIGPGGAVLYWVNTLLYQRWSDKNSDFGRLAAKVQRILDWAPAHLIAASFAIVGDFEGTIGSWRNTLLYGHDRIQRILCASALGALNTHFDEIKQEDNTENPSLEKSALLTSDPIPRNHSALLYSGLPASAASSAGEENPAAELLCRAIGLIWRTLLLWLTIASLFYIIKWLFMLFNLF